MGYLFNRDFSMRIGTAVINMQTTDPITDRTFPALRVSFHVEKSDNRDPNKVTLEIINLNESNRRVLQEGSELAEKTPNYDWPLSIEAGYVGNRSQIFSGDIIKADSFKEGVNWVTQIEAGDGQNNYRSARMSKSFGPGTTMTQLLTQAAVALGVGLGNSATKFAVSPRGLLNFKKGVAVSGRVTDVLDKYITSAGYDWSIQDGNLQVLGPGEILIGEAVVLNKSSGLVGSPEPGEKGEIKVLSLLQGAISPGRQIIIDSLTAKGSFKARKVVHVGDSWGQDWYTEFEGKPIQ